MKHVTLKPRMHGNKINTIAAAQRRFDQLVQYLVSSTRATRSGDIEQAWHDVLGAHRYVSYALSCLGEPKGEQARTMLAKIQHACGLVEQQARALSDHSVPTWVHEHLAELGETSPKLELR
jgi:hypothetical protein